MINGISTNSQDEYKGKAIDFDRYAGVQCADGAREYIEKSWRIKSAWFKALCWQRTNTEMTEFFRRLLLFSEMVLFQS